MATTVKKNGRRSHWWFKPIASMVNTMSFTAAFSALTEREQDRKKIRKIRDKKYMIYSAWQGSLELNDHLIILNHRRKETLLLVGYKAEGLHREWLLGGVRLSSFGKKQQVSAGIVVIWRRYYNFYKMYLYMLLDDHVIVESSAHANKPDIQGNYDNAVINVTIII